MGRGWIFCFIHVSWLKPDLKQMNGGVIMKKGLVLILLVIGIIGLAAVATAAPGGKEPVKTAPPAVPAGYPPAEPADAKYVPDVSYANQMFPAVNSHATWDQFTDWKGMNWEYYLPYGHQMQMIPSDFNYINMDVMGSKNSAGTKKVDWIYVEYYLGADTCITDIWAYTGAIQLWSNSGDICTPGWHYLSYDIPNTAFPKGLTVSLRDQTGSVTTGTDPHIVWVTMAGARIVYP
jgi:hypothetical protein